MNINRGIGLSNDYLDTIGGYKNDSVGTVNKKYSSSMSNAYKIITEKINKGKVITFFKNFAVIDGVTYNGVTKEGFVKNVLSHRFPERYIPEIISKISITMA